MGTRSFGTKGHPNGQVFTDYNGNTRIALYDGTGSSVARGALARVGYDATYKRLCAKALASTDSLQLFVIAAEPVAAYGKGDYYIAGSNITLTVPSTTYTAGRGLYVRGTAIVQSGSAYAPNGTNFAAVDVGGSTVTSVTVSLFRTPVRSLNIQVYGEVTQTAGGQADGTSIPCTTSRANALEINADSGATALSGDYYVSAIKGNFVMGTACPNASIIGVLGGLNTNTASFGSGDHYAVRGHLDYWGVSTQAGANNNSGAVSAYVECEAAVTINAGNYICGVQAYQVGTTPTLATSAAFNPAIWIRAANASSWASGIHVSTYGLKANADFVYFDAVISGVVATASESPLVDISATANAGYIRVSVASTVRYIPLYAAKTS